MLSCLHDHLKSQCTRTKSIPSCGPVPLTHASNLHRFTSGLQPRMRGPDTDLKAVHKAKRIMAKRTRFGWPTRFMDGGVRAVARAQSPRGKWSATDVELSTTLNESFGNYGINYQPIAESRRFPASLSASLVTNSEQNTVRYLTLYNIAKTTKHSSVGTHSSSLPRFHLIHFLTP